MKIGYYPGCSLHGTAREFGESVLAVAGAIGASLEEIEDWNCCGASSAHVVNHRLAVALSARNLALAEAQGFEQVLAPCAACYNRLATARDAMAASETLRAELPAIIGRPLPSHLAIRNILQFLLEALPSVRERVSVSLNGLPVVCYYGCLLVRPGGITGCDDPERPSTMEEIARACGAKPLAWHMAVECCGGALSVSRTSSVIRLGRAILDDARKAGARAIVVACPMCHSNLDFRQEAMRRNGEAPLPILYVTELVGLAMGLAPETLGLARHFVEAGGLLDGRAIGRLQEAR